jgi:hypothetical protein
VSWSIANINCHKNPISHIWSSTLVSRNTYDNLYEQWNNIEHQHWKKFIDDMKVEVYFHTDFTHMLIPKKSNEYIGYWFFQQRTDRSTGGEIELINGTDKKILSYWSNTILIIESDKSFTVLPRKHELPQRPFCEMYFDQATNKKIKKLLY